MIIKIGTLKACECSKNQLDSFLNSYHKLFPELDITVNDKKVFFFDKGYII